MWIFFSPPWHLQMWFSCFGDWWVSFYTVLYATFRMMLRELIMCRNMFVMVVRDLLRERNRTLWMDDENIVWRSQRDLPCYPLLPFCLWSGIGWSMPCPFCFFAVIVRRRDPRNVCNAWRIHPFFSGDIIDVLLWALQLNASECDGSIYETMFYFFVLYATLMDNDLGWLPHRGSRLVRGQFRASCLWRLEI